MPPPTIIQITNTAAMPATLQRTTGVCRMKSARTRSIAPPIPPSAAGDGMRSPDQFAFGVPTDCRDAPADCRVVPVDCRDSGASDGYGVKQYGHTRRLLLSLLQTAQIIRVIEPLGGGGSTPRGDHAGTKSRRASPMPPPSVTRW